MKTLIFMNECIREKKPGHPVIRAVRGRDVVEANLLRIMVGKKEVGRVIFDPKNSPTDTHQVVAWIELNEKASVSL